MEQRNLQLAPPPPPAAVRRPAWRTVVLVLQRAALNFSEDRGTHMAAAIAYYALFSLFPLVTLAVSLFGFFLRDDARRARVVEALVEALPVEPGGITDPLVEVAATGPTLTLLAALATIWSASALLSVVRRSLGVAFAVQRGRPLLRGKALDILLAPLLGGAFLLSMTITAFWRLVQQAAEGTLPFIDGLFGWAWDLGAMALSAAVAFLGFLFVYRILPGRQVALRHLWGGALLAALGFEVIKQGFALYLANFGNYDVVYGSLGGALVLLFWVYLSANILLMGAEVAAETPLVLRGEPRRGRATQPGVRRPLRAAVWAFLVGLVAAPGDSAGPALPAERRPDEPTPVEVDPPAPRSQAR